MDETKRLIEDNRQKLHYLHSYLELNRAIEETFLKGDLDSARALIQKKRALMTGIRVIDDKIIRRIARLKESHLVEDLSELNPAEVPNLKELKSVAMDVLRKMVEVKNSDAILDARLAEAAEKPER